MLGGGGSSQLTLGDVLLQLGEVVGVNDDEVSDNVLDGAVDGNSRHGRIKLDIPLDLHGCIVGQRSFKSDNLGRYLSECVLISFVSSYSVNCRVLALQRMWLTPRAELIAINGTMISLEKCILKPRQVAVQGLSWGLGNKRSKSSCSVNVCPGGKSNAAQTQVYRVNSA